MMRIIIGKIGKFRGIKQLHSKATSLVKKRCYNYHTIHQEIAPVRPSKTARLMWMVSGVGIGILGCCAYDHGFSIAAVIDQINEENNEVIDDSQDTTKKQERRKICIVPLKHRIEIDRNDLYYKIAKDLFDNSINVSIPRIRIITGEPESGKTTAVLNAINLTKQIFSDPNVLSPDNKKKWLSRYDRSMYYYIDCSQGLAHGVSVFSDMKINDTSTAVNVLEDVFMFHRRYNHNVIFVLGWLYCIYMHFHYNYWINTAHC